MLLLNISQIFISMKLFISKHHFILMSATDLARQQARRKELQQFVRPGLDIHQLEEIQQVFDTFDLKQTGMINPRELKNAIKKQGAQAQNSALYQLICDLDQQGGGMITFQDFIFFMTPTVTGQETYQEIERIFKLFDDQKTGFLTINGLRRISKKLNLQFEQQDIMEKMRQADLDKDGFINCQEFYDAVSYKMRPFDLLL